jgi:cytochrome c peroxidase
VTLRRCIAIALGLLVAGCEPPRPDAAPPGPATPGEGSDAPAPGGWTESQLALLESLSLAALPPPPLDPSNRVADDPVAAELGHRLFFDPGLSGNGRVSCATCHLPDLLFSDGRTTSRGIADTARNAPTLVGVAHSPWLFWDGRRDSLWAQALAPLETAAEMGSTRVAVVRHVAREPRLAALYARVFGEVPAPDGLPERAGPFGSADEQAAWQRMAAHDRRRIDRAFANVGKAIAAYERLLEPGPSRFDRYVESLRRGGVADADARLSDDELRGLRLFADVGRSQCLRCHNGPLLTNQSFHDAGTVGGAGGFTDFGRFLGIQSALIDPFNCLGEHSDARPEQCGELRFLAKQHLEGEIGKFKTPTLRGLPRTGPYMHDGRFATLDAVVEHYRKPPAGTPPQEIAPLEIDDAESRTLVAFLASLDGGTRAPERWLRPPPVETASQR